MLHFSTFGRKSCIRDDSVFLTRRHWILKCIAMRFFSGINAVFSVSESASTPASYVYWEIAVFIDDLNVRLRFGKMSVAVWWNFQSSVNNCFIADTGHWQEYIMLCRLLLWLPKLACTFQWKQTQIWSNCALVQKIESSGVDCNVQLSEDCRLFATNCGTIDRSDIFRLINMKFGEASLRSKHSTTAKFGACIYDTDEISMGKMKRRVCFWVVVFEVASTLLSNNSQLVWDNPIQSRLITSTCYQLPFRRIS